MKYVLRVIMVFFIAVHVHAFNWSKCDRQMNKASPFGLFLSSSQFITSTGGCAMIGMSSHDKKVFIAQNIDKIETDSARGEGKYLTAYAKISGCDEQAVKQLGTNLKNQFEDIYGKKDQNYLESVYFKIENELSQLGCKCEA